MPRFSVIIPCFNAAGSLQYCLNSLVDQTLTNDFEVVAVNDGSTDETLEILNSYSQHLDLVIVDQENKGLGGARNAAIEVAQGEFLAFLDADDFWVPENLTVCRDFLDSTKLDLVCHCEFKGYISETGFKPQSIEVHGKRATFREILLFGNCLSPSAVVVKRQLVLDVGMFSLDPRGRGVEDWHLWLSIAKIGGKFGYIDSALGYYVMHSQNMSAEVDFYDRVLHVFDTNASNVLDGSVMTQLAVSGARHLIICKKFCRQLLAGDSGIKLRHFGEFLSIHFLNPYFWLYSILGAKKTLSRRFQLKQTNAL